MALTRSATLSDEAKSVLDAPNFATIATIGPDGAPHASVVWVDRDDGTILCSSQSDRQKVRNLQRDSRVSVAIFDGENPYYSIEIRGSADLVADPERTLPQRLSQKYLGQDPPPEPGTLRVIVRVTPDAVIEFSP